MKVRIENDRAATDLPGSELANFDRGEDGCAAASRLRGSTFDGVRQLSAVRWRRGLFDVHFLHRVR